MHAHTSRRQTSLKIGIACLAWLILASAGTVIAEETGQSAPQPPPKIIDAATFPSLQAAFDAVPASGGLVQLPPGRFELTEPLVLERGDTRIVGCGGATHLVNKNEKGQPALVLRAPGRDKNPKAYAWRVQVADFRISGNPKSGDGLRAEHINEIYIHGLSVDHNGGHGIHMIDCLEDPRLSDSIITYNAKAGVNIVAGHDIVVSANQFEENQDALRCINSYNLCMTGNNLDDHLRHGVVIENTYGSVVSGNMIEECRGVAIILDRNCYGITLSANVIAHDFGGGIDLRDAHGCSVSANTFVLDRSPVRGVRVGPKSGRIAISGNSFCNSYIGEGSRRQKSDDPAEGILLEKTSDVAITGNTFSGLSHEAVKAVGPCQRIVIVGNTVVEVSRAEPGKHKAFDVPEADVDTNHNKIHEGKPAKP